jgi:hypothetical protein
VIFQHDIDTARRLAADHRGRISQEKTPETRASVCRKLARRLRADLAETLRDTIESQIRANASIVDEFARCLDQITAEINAAPKPVARPVQAIGSIS